MLQLRSLLDVADNTGARRVSMIHALGQTKRYGYIGDVVKVHVKEAAPDGNIKKGDVCDAVEGDAPEAARKQGG